MVENVRSEFFETSEIERDKLSAFVKDSVSRLADQLAESISQKQEAAEERFSEQINELATNILSGILLKEISSNTEKNTKDINERFETISSSLKKIASGEVKQLQETITRKLDEYDNSILGLEKTSIELNDQINKGTNRALSRIGNIKTQLEESLVSTKDELTNLINEADNKLTENILGKINIAESNVTDFCNAKIETAENKIKNFYNEKIALVEEKVIDLTTENKQYFVNLINESKVSLLNEISNIKVNVPNIVVERSNGKQEVDLKGIKSELEKIIGTRFSNELQSLKRLIEMSSGGGSVAKQFAAGGTMEGTLNVTGQYLSGGVDLLTIFASGGDDIEVNTLVRANSGNWDSAYNTSVVYQSNSATYSTVDFVNSKFFPLSGGIITGDTRFNSNVTVFGNLTTTGTTTFANTVFSVTSALSVVHIGAGPAMWVGNNGSGDIASFYDIDTGVEVLHVGGDNGTFPNVGIKTSTPNKTLTVSGEISATSDITTSGKIYIQNDGNSDQWNSTFTTVQANSSNWDSTYTNYQTNSSNYILSGSNANVSSVIFGSSSSILETTNDVRNWWLTGKTKNVGLEDATPQGIYFKSDGTKMFILGATSDSIRTYTLSAAWDVSTAVLAADSLFVGARDGTPNDLYISPDGLKLFVVGASNDRVYEFTLSAAWTVSSAVFNTSISITTLETNALGLTFSPDGTNMFVVGQDFDRVYRYTLSEPFRLSAAALTSNLSISAFDSIPHNLAFNDSGTRMYMLGSTFDSLYEFTLDDPWDVSTAILSYRGFTLTQEGVPTGLYYNESANRAYFVGSNSDTVYEWSTDKQLYYSGDSFAIDSQLYVQGRTEFRDTVYLNNTLNSTGPVNFTNSLALAGNMSSTSGSTSLGNVTTGTTIQLAPGATVAGSGKTVEINTNGLYQSRATTTIGNSTSGTITLNNSTTIKNNCTVVNGLSVQGKVRGDSASESPTDEIAVLDTFTEATTVNLSSHIPDIGTSWSRVYGTATFNVSGGRMGAAASVADAGAIYIEQTNLTSSDYEVSVDIPVQVATATDDVIHLIARYVDVNNYYLLKWSTTAANCALYQNIGGTFTTLATFPTVVTSGATTLSLRVVGDRITVLNGGVVRTHLQSTLLPNPGKAGIGIGALPNNLTDDTNVIWKFDNFKVQYYSGGANTIIENGNVGIGNTTPNERLTVTGNLSVTGNIASSTNYITTLALSANKTANNGTDTPILFDYIKDDPNSWVSGVTATKITPTIPGYYFVSYQISWQGGTSGSGNQNNIQILKNNSTISLTQQPINSSNVNTTQTTTGVAYLNGSTDYLNFQAYSSNSAQVMIGTSDGAWSKVEVFKIN